MTTEAEERDPHRHHSPLSQLILGGQDGLVNVLGVVLGVAAASHDRRLVLVAGLAAALAESISMAAVAYTARRADAALFEAEQAREHRHIRDMPELERQEIRDIYARKGIGGQLLDDVVDAITRNPKVWVAVMMAEELQLSPVPKGSAARASVIVGLSSLVGSLVPLAPYLVLAMRPATVAAIGLAGAVLFALGAYKAAITVGRWWWSGLELAAIGLASAMAGYGVGLLFSAGP